MWDEIQIEDIEKKDGLSSNAYIGYNKLDKISYVVKRVTFNTSSLRQTALETLKDNYMSTANKNNQILKPKYISQVTEGGKYVLLLLSERQKYDLKGYIDFRNENKNYLSVEELRDIVRSTLTNFLRMEKEVNHGNLQSGNILFGFNNNEIKFTDNFLISQDRQLKKSVFYPTQDWHEDDKVGRDIWGLGILFLMLATLENEKELYYIKDDSSQAGDRLNEVKEIIEERYGQEFKVLIEKMIEGKWQDRQTFKFLNRYKEDFLNSKNKFAGGPQQKGGKASFGDQSQVKDLYSVIHSKVTKNKQTTVQKFFQQNFDMHQKEKQISYINFKDAMHDLNIEMKDQTWEAVQKVLDEDGEQRLNLRDLIDYSPDESGAKDDFYSKLRELEPRKEEKLKQLMSDMARNIQEEQKNLKPLFQQEDLDKQEKLHYTVFFQVLRNEKFGLIKEEEELIQQKFDVDNERQINYIVFIEQLDKLTKIDENLLDHISRQLFDYIKTHYGSFDDLMFEIKRGSDTKDIFEYSEIVNLIKDGVSGCSQASISAFMKQIVEQKGAKTVIYPIKFRKVFSRDAEIFKKDFINKISIRLMHRKIDFLELMAQYTSSKKVIGYERFLSALDDLQFVPDVFNEKELKMMLYLSDVQIALNKDIEFNTFRKYLYITGVEMGVVELDQLKDPSDKEEVRGKVERQVSFSKLQPSKNQRFKELIEELTEEAKVHKQNDLLFYFDIQRGNDQELTLEEFREKNNNIKKLNSEDLTFLFETLDTEQKTQISAKRYLSLLDVNFNQKKATEVELINGIDVKRLEPSRKFFAEIKYQLGVLKPPKLVEEYFYDKNNKLRKDIFEERVRQLISNFSYFQTYYNSIVKTIQLEDNNERVDMLLFYQLMEHFAPDTKLDASTTLKQEKLVEVINWVIKIQQAASSKHQFNIRKEIDKNTDNNDQIKFSDFSNITMKYLELRHDASYETFQDFFTTQEKKFDVKKFLEYYQLEEKALILMSEIQELIRLSKIQVQQIFQDFDNNDDQQLNQDEFSKLIQFMLEDKPQKELLDYLFNRTDFNGDGNIAIREFKHSICGLELKTEDIEMALKGFVLELQICMRAKNQSFQQAFGEDRDELTQTHFMRIVDDMKMNMNSKQITSVVDHLYKKKSLIEVQQFQKVYDEYKKIQSVRISDQLTEKDLKAYAKEIVAGMNDKQIRFRDSFQVKETGQRSNRIEKNDVEDILMYDLKMSQSGRMKQFLQSLEKQCEEKGLIKLDRLEELLQIKNNHRSEDSDSDGAEKKQKLKIETPDESDEEKITNQRKDAISKEIQDNFKHINKATQQLDPKNNKSIQQNDFLEILENNDIKIKKWELNSYVNIMKAQEGKDKIDYDILFTQINQSTSDDSDVPDGGEQNDFNTISANIKRLLKQQKEKILDFGITEDQDFTGKIDEQLFYNLLEKAEIQVSKEEQATIRKVVKCSRGDLDYVDFAKQVADEIIDLQEIEQEQKQGNSQEKEQGQEREKSQEKDRRKQSRTPSDSGSGSGSSKSSKNSDDMKQTIRPMTQQQIVKLTKEFGQQIQNYMAEFNTPSITVMFRKFDKSDRGYITYSDFEKATRTLFPTLGKYSFNKQTTRAVQVLGALFQQIDKDRDEQLNLDQFKALVYDDLSKINIKPLLKKLRQQIDPSDQDDLKEQFQQMDKNGNKLLDEAEFQKAMKNFNKNIKDNELMALFGYFDKDKTGQINFQTFVEVLNEDHLNLDKIKKQVNDQLQKENMNIRAFFNQFDSAKQGEWNDNDLKKAMKKIGFEFDDDQVDELFGVLDQSKLGKINFDDFQQSIFEENINVQAVLKKFRREIIKKDINLWEECQKLDRSESNVLMYHPWCQMLRSKGIDFSPNEFNVIFKRFKNKRNQEEINYRDLCQELESINADLSEIRDQMNEFKARYNSTLEEIFTQFLINDKSGKTMGYYDFDNFLQNIGLNIPNEEFNQIFSAFDIQQRQCIEMHDFIEIIEGRQHGSDRLEMQRLLYNHNNYHRGEQSFQQMGSGLFGSDVHSYIRKDITVYEDDYRQQDDSRYSRDEPVRDTVRKDLNFYINALKEASRQLDLLEIFGMWDRENMFQTRSYSDFQLIMKRLMIPVGRELQEIFREFIRPQKILNYLQLLKQVFRPQDLYKKLILRLVQIYEISLKDYFQEIIKVSGKSATIDTWSLDELDYFNVSMKLGYSRNHQVMKVLQEFANPKRPNSITLEDLAYALQVPPDFKPKGYNPTNQTNDPASTSFYNESLQSLSRDTAFYVEQIAKKCDSMVVNLLDVFTFFDNEGFYTLDEKVGPNAVYEVLGHLGIEIDNHARFNTFYNEFVNQDGKFAILKLIRHVVKHTSIFISVMYNIMVYQEYSFVQFFKEILQSPNRDYWTIQEFKYINEQLVLYMSQTEVQTAFQSLFLKNTQITEKQLSLVLDLNINDNKDIIQRKYTRIIQDTMDYLQTEAQKYNISKQNIPNPMIKTGEQFGQNPSNYGGKFGYRDENRDNHRENSFDRDRESRYGSKERDSQKRVDFKIDSRMYKQILDDVTQAVNQSGFQFTAFSRDAQTVSKASVLSCLKNNYQIPDTEQLEMFVQKLLNGENSTELRYLADVFRYTEFDKRDDRFVSPYQTVKEKQDFMPRRNDYNEQAAFEVRNRIWKQVFSQDTELMKNQFFPPSNQNQMVTPPNNQPFFSLLFLNFKIFHHQIKAGSKILSLSQFLQLAKYIQQQLQQVDYFKQSQYELFFMYLDIDQSNQVTYTQMANCLQDLQRNSVNKRKPPSSLNEEIETEIQTLFDEIDKNKSGKIEKQQIVSFLSSIGINSTDDEIQYMLQKFDKNNDGQISYNEFKLVLEDKLRKEIITAEDIIDDIKKQFRNVDTMNKKCLNIAQVGQVFQNLQTQLNQEELNALFSEIDTNNNKLVDIDELTSFIMKNQDSGTSHLAMAAVLNIDTKSFLQIRSTRKLSIIDLRNAFMKMPHNFILSFVRQMNKKGRARPSHSFKPIYNSLQLYEDIVYSEIKTLDPTRSVLQRNPAIIPNNYCLEITLAIATGIPIPDAEKIPRNSIVHREVLVCLFDESRNQYIGNTIRIPARWMPEYEDRWYFGKRGLDGDNSLIIRFANYQADEHANVSVVFEFVIHYSMTTGVKVNSQQCDIEINCSCGVINLADIVKGGDKQINLKGGDPKQIVHIKETEIRTNRTGWRSVVQALSANIISCLQIEVNPRVSQREINDILVLPKTVIFNKNALPILQTYREYFAYKTIQNRVIDPNLQHDPTIQSFLAAIDCPDIFYSLIYFWKDEILPRVGGDRNLLQEKLAFQTISAQIYLLLIHPEFNFKASDPTASSYAIPSINGSRRILLEKLFQDVRVKLKLQQGIITGDLQQNSSAQTFNLNELIDDDEDQLYMLNAIDNLEQKPEIK